MGFLIHIRHFMEVRHQAVYQVEAQRAHKDPRYGHEQSQQLGREGGHSSSIPRGRREHGKAVVYRGHNESQHGGGQHDSGGKGQNDVGKAVRGFLEQETDQGTNDGGTAHTEGGQ